MKTFEEFLKDLETDDTLKVKVKNALKTVEEKTEEAKISVLVKIAAENGYHVSTENFAKHQASCQELDEDELNLVSGGGYCFETNACAVVFDSCNSSENSSENCPLTLHCPKLDLYL